MNEDTWNIVVTTPDAVARDYPNILQQMADLEHSAVIIRGFYPLDHCAEMVRRIESDTTGLVDAKKYVTTGGNKLELRYIGPGLERYVRDREGFFREPRLSDRKFERLFYDGLPGRSPKLGGQDLGRPPQSSRRKPDHPQLKFVATTRTTYPEPALRRLRVWIVPVVTAVATVPESQLSEASFYYTL